MTLFVVVALLLVLLPGLVIAWQARRGEGADVDREALNVALFRERRAELDADLAAGRLDAPLHGALLAELEKLLVDDVAGMAPGGVARRSRAALLFPLLVPALVLPLYLATGFAPEVRRWIQVEGRDVDAARLQAPVDEASHAALVDAARVLQSQLPREAGNADDWMMLGTIWADVGMIELARQSLQEALRLQPDHRDASLALARLEIALMEGRLDENARGLLDDLLARDPDDAPALLTYALGAFAAGDYETAIRHFLRLRVLLPETEVSARTMIDEALVAAQARQSAASAGGQRVTVRLSEPLVMPPAAALFVIVRRGDGSPMPVAVRKLPPMLPADIVLTDADLLVEGVSLGMAGPLEVLARLSLHGDARAASGDIESEPLTLALDGRQVAELMLTRPVP